LIFSCGSGKLAFFLRRDTSSEAFCTRLTLISTNRRIAAAAASGDSELSSSFAALIASPSVCVPLFNLKLSLVRTFKNLS
jgi:hypothetical protein